MAAVNTPGTPGGQPVSVTGAPGQLTGRDANGRRVNGPSLSGMGRRTPAILNQPDMREYGVNTPRMATPIDDAPNLYPRLIALRTYERMMRSDAQVRTAVRACKVPILGGEWFVDPASNEQNDLDAAEFAMYNFRSLAQPWTRLLEDILRFFEYGDSVFEKVWTPGTWAPHGPNRNSRPVVLLKKLAYRPPVTISNFYYDENGGPLGVHHVAPIPVQPIGEQIGASGNPFNVAENPWGAASSIGYGSGPYQQNVFIPIDKMVVFTYDQYGGDLVGNSILRTAYKHWYYKEYLYKIDGIQKERHGIGIPKITLPPGYNDADKAYAEELGMNLRTDEQAFILQPPGWEVDFAELKGQPVNALQSAEHHNIMITLNVMVQFIIQAMGGSFGTSASGGGGSGRGGGAAVSYDLFLKSLRYIGNYICDTFNLYVIPQMIDYNFNVKRYPQLKVRRIGENRDMQMFAVSMRNLVQSNVISVDDKTEAWVREELDMPKTWDRADARMNQSLLVNTQLLTSPTNEESGEQAPTNIDLEQSLDTTPIE